MNNLQKRYDSLYALKALAAFFVVMIHFPMWGCWILEPIIRIAVPLFYLVSGFFLYSGSQTREIGKALRWIRKIVICSLLLNAFYAIWRIAFLHECISGRMVLSALLTGEGICVPLWFLTAMWQGLFVFVLLRRWKEKWLPAVPALCLLNPLLGRYCFLFMEANEQLPTFVRSNFLTVALPFICLGYLASKFSWAHRWGKIIYPIILGG